MPKEEIKFWNETIMPAFIAGRGRQKSTTSSTERLVEVQKMIERATWHQPVSTAIEGNTHE